MAEIIPDYIGSKLSKMGDAEEYVAEGNPSPLPESEEPTTVPVMTLATSNRRKPSSILKKMKKKIRSKKGVPSNPNVKRAEEPKPVDTHMEEMGTKSSTSAPAAEDTTPSSPQPETSLPKEKLKKPVARKKPRKTTPSLKKTSPDVEEEPTAMAKPAPKPRKKPIATKAKKANNFPLEDSEMATATEADANTATPAEQSEPMKTPEVNPVENAASVPLGKPIPKKKRGAKPKPVAKAISKSSKKDETTATIADPVYKPHAKTQAASSGISDGMASDSQLPKEASTQSVPSINSTGGQQTSNDRKKYVETIRKETHTYLKQLAEERKQRQRDIEDMRRKLKKDLKGGHE